MIIKGKLEKEIFRLGNFKKWAWIESSLLGLISLVVYLANGIFTNPSGDVVPASVLPFSIILHHNFYIGRYLMFSHQDSPYYLDAFKNHFISAYPIGSAITALPVYLIFLLFGGHATAITGAILGKISASIISGASVIWLYWTMERLSIKRSVKIVFAILYGLGSETMSISSQGLWQHGPAQFWIVGFLYFVVMAYDRERARAWIYICTGISVGMILLSRPVDLLLILPFLILLRNQHIRKNIWITVATFVPFLAFNMAYDHYFHGHIVSTGYGSVAKELSLFSFPLIPGLLGNLFSPSKGLFVFMPWALISFAWITRFRSQRFNNSIYFPALLSFFPYIVLYALYYQWSAGASYGPRYMTDVLPLLAILGSGYMTNLNIANLTLLKLNTFRALTGLVIAWSIALQLLGTYVPGGSAWNDAYSPNNFFTPLWIIRGSEAAYYFNTLKSSLLPAAPITKPDAIFSNMQLLYKPYIYEKGIMPSIFIPNTTYVGTVVVKNAGSQGWSAYPSSSGGDVVHFSYNVWQHRKLIASVSGLRSALLHSVQPGKSIKIYFHFVTPSIPGKYTYVFTLVDEGVCWFQNELSSTNADIATIKVG
ncbi:hypothetical protein AYW79_06270 [Ferroacidibacillus organovorans]|uniref:Glycosyltransferase RgtA/B/C/D-like domain-containing protein n=1 Tax=Ferroacidibacillus organovorans TaxID=1765683 RepID=A0A853KFT1_9BACL|nr:hypothetical protein AYJ22_06060 [Ferroacidibacillus organovorans]OAG94220.1 hypothetical protein AYW79_06270 [Ferroacidibacillus organovorans]